MSRQICAAIRRGFAKGHTRCISTKGTEVSAQAGYKPFSDVPQVEGLPVIGTLLDYTRFRGFRIEHISKMWRKRHDEYGDIYKEKFGKNYTVYCRSQQDNNTIFQQEGRFPIRSSHEAVSFIKKAGGMPESILNMNGEDWYKYRKYLNQALLNNNIVWKYIQEQAEVSEDLTRYIMRNMDENGEIDNFATILDRWAFEMSCTFLLNCRLGLLDDSPNPVYLDMFKRISDSFDFIAKSFGDLNLWRYFETKESKKVIRDVKQGYKTLRETFDEKLRGKYENTVFEQLMKSEELTMIEKQSLLFDVLVASINTTSKSTSLLIYALTLNNYSQNKLREEVLALPPDEQLTGRILGTMEYMTAFIKEAMRLLPFTHSHFRLFDKDIILSGYQIPAGTNVIVTANSSQNKNPDFFPEPDKFLPERWMGNQVPPKSLLTGTFGIGAKSCPGRRFAMQEMRLLLITLLRNFEVGYRHKPIESWFRGNAIPSEEPRFSFTPLNKT